MRASSRASARNRRPSAYGFNRADWSYIPGGVISGTALDPPGLARTEGMALFLAAAGICDGRRRDQLHVPRPRRRPAVPGRRQVKALALLALLAAAPAAASTVTVSRYGTMPDGRAVERDVARQRSRHGGPFDRLRRHNHRDRRARPARPQGQCRARFASLADYVATNESTASAPSSGAMPGALPARASASTDATILWCRTTGRTPSTAAARRGSTSSCGASPAREGQSVGAVLSYTSPDGEQGFPGRPHPHRHLPPHARQRAARRL